MTRKNLVVAAVGMVLSALLLMAAGAPVGSWECVSAAPGGGSSEMSWTLDITDVDGKLVGTAGSDQGQVPVDNLKFEDGTLTFSVSIDSGTYDITLKVDGNKIEGNWKGGGETGPIKGSKKA